MYIHIHLAKCIYINILNTKITGVIVIHKIILKLASCIIKERFEMKNI